MGFSFDPEVSIASSTAAYRGRHPRWEQRAHQRRARSRPRSVLTSFGIDRCLPDALGRSRLDIEKRTLQDSIDPEKSGGGHVAFAFAEARLTQNVTPNTLPDRCVFPARA